MRAEIATVMMIGTLLGASVLKGEISLVKRSSLKRLSQFGSTQAKKDGSKQDAPVLAQKQTVQPAAAHTETGTFSSGAVSAFKRASQGFKTITQFAANNVQKIAHPVTQNSVSQEQTAELAGFSTLSHTTRRELFSFATFDKNEDGSEREIKIFYRSHTIRHRLFIRVQGFENGSQFTVLINKVPVTTVESVENSERVEAAADFRDSNWPQGVPAELAAGMSVQVIDEDGKIVHDGVLEE